MKLVLFLLLLFQNFIVKILKENDKQENGHYANSQKIKKIQDKNVYHPWLWFLT